MGDRGRELFGGDAVIGVDLASVDGNAKPDWAAARRAGVRFVFERANQGAWQDPVAARDRDAIRAAGLVYGAYAIGPGTPSQLAATFKASAGLVPGVDLPPVMDVEFPRGIAGTGMSRAQIAAWLGDWRKALEDAFGVTPMVYSSARVLDDTDSDSLAGAADDVLAGCPLWLARYPVATRIDARFDADGWPLPPLPKVHGAALWIHQYQGDALHVPGFTSTVDMDRFFPLANGETSSRVQWVQKRMGAADNLTPGVNDLACRVAIKAWQAAHGLEADGIVGPATFARLAWQP